MSNLTPDLCVIGAGAAGLSAAAGAARLGVPVVLVERAAIDGIMGGECLHRGCVPSKALLAVAARAQAMRDAGRFALPPAEPIIDWPTVRAHVRKTIATIAPTDSIERYRAMGVTVIEGSARFKDRCTLTIDDRTVRARRFVIATGADPAVPQIAGLERVSWLTSDTIFEVDVLPTHLIILGAGPIGIELAQAFRRLGSAVTILGAGQPLAREDAEMSAPVLETLAREGVTLRAGISVRGIEPAPGGGVELSVEHGDQRETIVGSHLLIAIGRKPRVDNMGLELAGVAHDARGIRVRADGATSNRRVFAIGDVVDGPRFTHVASHEAALMLRKTVFRLPARFVAAHMPRVTYTQPELAAVGLDEDAARQKHKRLRILRADFSEIDRARTDNAIQGHIKVIATRHGRVLGAAIVGEHAGELLAPWTLAVAGKLSVQDIAQTVVPYPTLSEVSRKAAIGFYAETLDRPILRRVLGWLRMLG